MGPEHFALVGRRAATRGFFWSCLRSSSSCLPVVVWPFTKQTKSTMEGTYMKTQIIIHRGQRSVVSAQRLFGSARSTRRAIVRWASTLAALMLLSGTALADSFFFSTGDPDGKIATLSRPLSPGGIQTETADDFTVTSSIVINQATFAGLVPLGAPLSSISDVEVELYHVFPGESDTNRALTVPTR